jgi:dTDP-4-dehydrorhamnose reductase
MNILVVGSNGMAGHVITRYLKSKKYGVTTIARSDADYNLDIENIPSIVAFFKEFNNRYDVVINCVGLLVKDSIERPDRAAILNSWFPHFLEYTFKNTETKVIHLSTDCVFDGQQGNYVENDQHTETNAYGKSKSLGEIINKKDITFRMSIIGPEIKKNGTGLLNWIVNNDNNELHGWENAWWNGITTLQLAKSIDTYLCNSTSVTGVYHLVNNNNKINKYELLCKINDVYRLEKTIIKATGPKDVNKILVDTRNEINFNIPDYNTQLEELKSFTL